MTELDACSGTAVNRLSALRKRLMIPRVVLAERVLLIFSIAATLSSTFLQGVCGGQREEGAADEKRYMCGKIMEVGSAAAAAASKQLRPSCYPAG